VRIRGVEVETLVKRKGTSCFSSHKGDTTSHKTETVVAPSKQERSLETLVKDLPRQPSDRAKGDGWQICSPLEPMDWAIVGTEMQSCFLFLYNENQSHRAREQQEREQQEMTRSLLTRPSTPCGSPMSKLAEDLRGRAVVC